ncbi:ATPase, T2SS/T4P/T4SS family [Rugamonas rubra]|nr:ATPase, T2SS/T4P/T4SS family [Rugamonas rubra]
MSEPRPMSHASKVRELDFSDLYLGHPGVAERFSDVPGAPANPLCAGPALRADLDRLAELCRGRLDGTPAASAFQVSHDEVNYRVTVLRAVAGLTFVLRKMAGRVDSLAALGLPQAYLHQLMARELCGLVIVAGAAKSGKTMSACALLRDRLRAHGGVAVTGERPIELPLEGSHGQGICFQTSMPAEPRHFAGAFRQLLRSGAQTILIDEIGDHETAVEVLQASVSGHLIVTTMLADSVAQAVGKLQALASHKLPAERSQALLADGLGAVLHQQLLRGPKVMLKAELLSLRGAAAVRASLRNGDHEMLASELRRQMASMISANAAAQRMAAA